MEAILWTPQTFRSRSKQAGHKALLAVKNIDLKPFYLWAGRLIVRMLYRVKYREMQHIPATGPAILICNHVSFMDGMVINAGINRPVRYVIDERIYHLPIIHYFMKLNRAVPIAARREAVERALEEIDQGLKAGELFCIFPEGQITYTGNLSRFRFGIEWMLKRRPVPVIPMALTGLWGSSLSRKDRGKWYRYIPRSFRRPVHLHCGPAMDGNATTISHMQQTLMRMMSK